MSATPRFRSVLDRFVGYVPGKAVMAPDGRSYKLSSNESPFGPPPAVLAAINEAALGVNRYPDNNCAALISEIAGRFGVPEEHIAVGTGSVGVTQMLLEAVGEPGAEILYAWRSFEAYPTLVALSGAIPVQIPLKDETHDLTAMAAAITDRTRLIFVCNPNNPTGTVVRRAELLQFLDQVPDDCLVVLDEAYREYVRDDDVPDGLTIYGNRPNVAVLRTFSKAYGLAGLRVGFLVGHPVVAAAVRKTFLPFCVNSIAQAAAVAALRSQDELMARVESTVKERERVHGALQAQGWTLPQTEANFVWLRLGEATLDFAAHCGTAGVAVRPFAGEGARVSIGSPEENDAFLAVAETFPARNRPFPHFSPTRT